VPKQQPDAPDPPEEVDSAGVYFVSVEDFEWRPEPAPAQDGAAESVTQDAEDPGDASHPGDVS
jgi:hypothetical protein